MDAIGTDSLGTLPGERSVGGFFGEHSLGSSGQLCSLRICMVAGLAVVERDREERRYD